VVPEWPVAQLTPVALPDRQSHHGSDAAATPRAQSASMPAFAIVGWFSVDWLGTGIWTRSLSTMAPLVAIQTNTRATTATRRTDLVLDTAPLAILGVRPPSCEVAQRTLQ